MTKVRLVTMNVWGTRGAWADRSALLGDSLRRLRPDLLTLQETIVTDGYDQVRDLLGDSYHLAHQSDREPDGQGISIASRWPLRNVRELDLQVSPARPISRAPPCWLTSYRRSGLFCWPTTSRVGN